MIDKERKKPANSEKFCTHGAKVVEMILKEKKLVDFIKMWRQHFLDTMRPKKMPFMWEENPEIYAKFDLQKPTWHRNQN